MRTASESGNGDTRSTAVQDIFPVGFSDDNLTQNDFRFSNSAFDTSGWPTPGEVESSLGNGGFDYQHMQDSAIDPTLGFAVWDGTQLMDNAFSNPTQLHTPPTTLDYDVAGKEITVQNLPKACSCLPDLYATLASFQSIPSPSFPFSMGTLKKAARLAHTVVRCQTCPGIYNTAVQNSMLLGTLMQMLINEYAKLLKYIDERSSSGEKIPFRVGEPTSPFDTRHTGGPDCPMSISIDLSGDEWRLLARKAVHQEIHGGDGADSVMGVLEQMRTRQEGLHQRFASEVYAPGHGHYDDGAGKSGEHMCLQINYIENLKKSLEMLKV